ncbi:MAG: sigma-54-dependent Fis family transcriptional regulator [Deltaproteobacteria bacterium]|nr:MAG: sigma-54-dependent Fis family transcriptional regulator [Deltaproteobacteria bacterium]
MFQTTPPSWAAVDAAFAALGRAVLLADATGRVVYASDALDRLACAGACARATGKPIDALLGPGLLAAPDGSVERLAPGERREGRRAFLHCPHTGAQLVSVTVAGVREGQLPAAPADARYLIVVRPAEQDDDLHASAAAVAAGLVARSPAMLAIVRTIEALRQSEATTLITGESGTGKEVVARAIHATSPRRRGPFVAINCGALPPGVLESELFGHARGAFTGAVRDRAGHLEAAAGGTLFLDEIGDLPLPLQVKLLRVLQERQFPRVGETRLRPFTARVIAATHVDLESAVANGSFRDDLYYRLRVIPIAIPPLRERPEDLEPLVRALLGRVCARTGRQVALAPDAMAALARYDWPGNVRELENALEYAVALSTGQTIHVDDLPETVRHGAAACTAPEAAQAAGGDASPAARPPPPARPPARPAAASTGRTTADAGEAARVRAALDAHRWNRTATARALGISRSTLWRKMRALGL